MNIRKFFMGIFVPFWLIMPAVEAYQELHEPDIVYIEYESKDGAANVLGMYEYAANALIDRMGQSCFQVMAETKNKNLTHNKRYQLLSIEDCNDDDLLFAKMIEFYQQAINASPDEVVADLVTKCGYVKIKKTARARYFSVEVNKHKKIITRLNV